jgi:hypothetical protein
MCAVKAIPDGYHSIRPSIVCKGAARAIDFYRRSFKPRNWAACLGRATASDTPSCLSGIHV